MMNNSLVVAYYFHHLFPALTAITHYRCQNKLNERSPAYIYIKTITFEEKTLITQIFPWVKFISLNDTLPEKIAFHRLTPVLLSARIFRKCYRHLNFDSIYFPHDVTSDFTAQIFMQSFPQAKKICYGDGLGNLMHRKNFEKYIYGNKKTWRSFLTLIYRNLKQLGCRWLEIESALLMVPVGFFKNCFDTINLEVIPQKHAFTILNKIKNSISAFNDYIDEICSKLYRPCFLFLPGHLTQAGMTTLKNEFRLYCEILQTHLSTQSTLILKSHPGGDAEIIELLTHWATEQGHDVIVFPKKYLNFPIEFSEQLLNNCRVLSISYTSISLPYLYRTSVEHVLNNSLIDKYCLPARKKFMQHYNTIYQTAQTNLYHWNGKEPLFCET